MSRIYLDYNATTPLRVTARAAMEQGFSLLGNASSIHTNGRNVRQHIEQARQKLADFFQRPAADVVFTSGATEANNLVINGMKGAIIASAIEHDSVLKARPGITLCPVNQDGVIELDQLETLLQTQKPELVSVMAANNETGVVQPLADITKLCRQYSCAFHVDAVQAIGKMPIDWSQLNIDYLSLSAHKIGGPSGIGALIINPAKALKAQMLGGGQERYYRAGTENLLGILGFAAALEAVHQDDWLVIAGLRDRLEQKLKTLDVGVEIFGHRALRLPNTTTIRMPGVKNNLQVMDFDLNGFAVSAGSACSSGKVSRSHVLAAMGIDQEICDQSIRVSLGWQTTAEEIDQFYSCWVRLLQRTQPHIAKRMAS